VVVQELKYQRLMFAVLLKDAIADIKNAREKDTKITYSLAVESVQRARGAAWMRYGVESKISTWLRKRGNEMQFLEVRHPEKCELVSAETITLEDTRK